jgi:hypothetical protein
LVFRFLKVCFSLTFNVLRRYFAALYKLNAMGLLPTHASDWVSNMKPPTPIEHAYGGTTL